MGGSGGSVRLLLLARMGLLLRNLSMKLLARTLVIKAFVVEPGMITGLGARQSL